MAVRGHSGRTPFEQLKHRYERVDLTCPQCGYDDADGSWQVATTGAQVQYRHVCPSCGAIRKRTMRLG